MKRFKFHHNFFTFAISLLIHDGVESEEFTNINHGNWGQFPVYSDKFSNFSGPQSGNSLSPPQNFKEVSTWPTNGNSPIFPQSYSTAGKQNCKFTRGKIRCRKRRDSDVGGYKDGGVKGGHVGFDTFGVSDGYGVPQQKATTFQYQIYPSMMESSSGWGMPAVVSGGWGQEEDEMGGDVDLKKYIGLLGLLGLKGLKGLKGVGLIKGLKGLLALPLLPFLPILLPILFLGLLAVKILPLLLLLFLPIGILLLTPLPAGRREGRTFQETSDLLKKVLNSEECVERISCELALLGKTFNAENLTERILKAIPKNNPYNAKIFQGIKESKKDLGKACVKFECSFPNLKLSLMDRNQTNLIQ